MPADKRLWEALELIEGVEDVSIRKSFVHECIEEAKKIIDTRKPIDLIAWAETWTTYGLVAEALETGYSFFIRDIVWKSVYNAADAVAKTSFWNAIKSNKTKKVIWNSIWESAWEKQITILRELLD
jgi:hypothetical protein